MDNIDGREALRGLEVPLFDLIAQVLAPKEWAKLLTDLLRRAACLGDGELVRKLVGSGVDTGTALHGAVGGGHADIVNYLLANGASVDDLDEMSRTPLHMAARMGRTDMVQLLVLKSADINAWDSLNWTPLYTAVHSSVGPGGDPAVLFALLAAGADVHRRSDKLFKRLPLHLAAFAGCADVLRALVEHGNDVNAVDVYQDTALHCAALGNDAEAINFLVEAGGNTGARNGIGFTPLHYTGRGFNGEALRCLLAHGADINAKDMDNRTVLHVAVDRARSPLFKEGAAEFVDLLLRSGADETIVDRYNKVAADEAIGLSQFSDSPHKNDMLVRELLAKAPADRAWRRRGFLAMCRAHPGRLQLRQETSSRCASMASRNRSRARICNNTMGGGARDERAGDEWGCVMAWVLGLQEDVIFRMIVEYL